VKIFDEKIDVQTAGYEKTASRQLGVGVNE
jgi:hypothetical protein